MSLLFETIKVKNGELQNIEFHNRRLKNSTRNLFGVKTNIQLEEIIKVPSDFSSGIYKCNVIYDTSIKEIKFAPYKMKNILRLKLVECNQIDYRYKYLDRSHLRKLFTQVQCSENEEILIIKNGFVTDTSYSNVALFNGDDWITPSTPLLAGTKRARLLKEKIIFERVITIEHLKEFRKAKLINAMIELDDAPSIPIETIIQV